MTGLDRRLLVQAALANRSADLLVVAGLGSASWDVTAAGDDDGTFPLWGAMGGAAMVGLGVALARPSHRVLVVTGDGEMLMGLGSLATIAVQAPANLALLVLDNEHYGETGMQPTHTGAGVDIAAVATACGWPSSRIIKNISEVNPAVTALRSGAGPVLVVAKVSTDPVPNVYPPRDGAALALRFQAAARALIPPVPGATAG